MDYQQLGPKERQGFISQRIISLEQEHWQMEISVRELLTHADPDDLAAMQRIREWKAIQARNEKALAMLREWAFTLALEDPVEPPS